MKFILLCIVSLLFVCVGDAQVPLATLVQIVKAEDARSYDKTLENLLRSPNANVRERAALAAGRIGREAALPALIELLANDTSNDVRAMAAFAIGEIESVKGADVILRLISSTSMTESQGRQAVVARAVEAAGKIAAANAKDPKALELGKSIVDVLESQNSRGKDQHRETALLALTAALRARPDKAETSVAKYLTNTDARIRADAGNTLSRLRAKNANEILRRMLERDTDAVARANAARALGAAEDKDSFNMLLKAATTDVDLRVRVSAIRSLAGLKDDRAAGPLIERGEKLRAVYTQTKKANYIPSEQNEFIEIATTLGRLLANTENERAVNLLRSFGKLDKGFSTEIYVAMTRIRQSRGDGKETPELQTWHQISTLTQMVGEFSVIEPNSDVGKQMKTEAPGIIRPLVKAFVEADPASEGKRMMAGPDALQAFARFKTADLGEVLHTALKNKDVQMRATAANLIGELPESKENIEALEAALNYSLMNDFESNDGQLAILDALAKFDKLYITRQADTTLNAPDYLVRKKTAEALRAKGVNEDPQMRPLDERVFPLRPYKAGNKSKQGVILNSEIDYRRAVSRKNGTIKAVVSTQKGSFTIDLTPEQAPLTVDNFIKLARSGYFNGLEVHRVVPNFVMQDGDPRGDGNGGPGWSIRCEVNMLPYDRGAVGMALSGKDTGGSQWFVTHSPQPHLDGGYTVFGHVNEKDMKVVDNIVRGDRILTIRINEPLSMRSRRR